MNVPRGNQIKGLRAVEGCQGYGEDISELKFDLRFPLQLMRSQVQGNKPGNSEVSKQRTSKTGWLQVRAWLFKKTNLCIINFYDL